jgi:Arginine/lysine/ornithine decarboxylases
MAKPLYDQIIRYAKSCPERFHMPAHFGANLDDLLYLSAVFDVTELPFSDNLQSPSGVIAESERQAASCYGSEATLYFTTGATTAIYVALGVLREYAGDLIIARASHKSVYAAARFFWL